jgi:hypothetical protein
MNILTLTRIKERVAKLRRNVLPILLYAWILAPFTFMFLDLRSLAILFSGLLLLTAVAYSDKKRGSPSLRLWDIQPRPNVKSFELAAKDMLASYKRYKRKLALSGMTFEFANMGYKVVEYATYVIVLIVYLSGTFYYIRINPPHPPKIDAFGLFLATYGIAVFAATTAGYFFILKTASSFFARWKLRRFNTLITRRIRYAYECMEPNEFQAGQRSRSVTLAEKRLRLVISGLQELDDLFKGVNVRLGAAATFLVGSITSLWFVSSYLEQYVGALSSQWRFFSDLVIFYSFMWLVYLIFFVNARMQILLKWSGADASMDEIEKTANRLMAACLGKKQSLVLQEHLHVAY